MGTENATCCCCCCCRYNTSIGVEKDGKRTKPGRTLEAPQPRTAWGRGALQWDGGEGGEGATAKL
jgi:hypothetical protein